MPQERHRLLCPKVNSTVTRLFEHYLEPCLLSFNYNVFYFNSIQFNDDIIIMGVVKFLNKKCMCNESTAGADALGGGANLIKTLRQ